MNYFPQVEELEALDDIQGKVINSDDVIIGNNKDITFAPKVDLSSPSTEYQKLWYQTWMDLRYQ